MNKDRRSRLNGVCITLEETLQRIGNILSEEEFAFDSMPEGLQGSERGEESEESIQLMDDAVEHIEEAISSLQSIFL